MSDADATSAPPDPSAALDDLHAENRALRQRLDELTRDDPGDDDAAGRLSEAADSNDSLRRRLGELALAAALREAADAVGVSEAAAATYRHRLRCTIGDDGSTRIEPNPTELLLRESRSDPLLRASMARRQERQHAAAAVAAGAGGGISPGDLLAALDRNPARKAEFIRRHGAGAFMELARRARDRGQ